MTHKAFFLSVTKKSVFVGLCFVLLVTITLTCIRFAFAVTPNPGHPWTQVGDGTFQVTGPSVLRTYTFPDSNATVLTNNSLVTVGQGGTGSSSLAANAVLLGNNTSAPQTVAPGNGGKVLSSNGTTWISNDPNFQDAVLAPRGLYAANNVDVTSTVSGVSYFEYVGKLGIAATTCDILQNVTAGAATITWAEVAIFKGGITLNGNASLTRLGYADVSGTYNTTGIKKTTVNLSGGTVGDNIWIVYGSNASGPFQVRALLADDLQTGVFQSTSVRPSLASSPQATTIESSSTAPARSTVKCQ